MAFAGETIANPISGEKFSFVKTGRETGGRFFEFIWELKPDGIMPFAHVHGRRSETFEVLAGELTLHVGGETHTLRPGESLTVPQGTVHQPVNRGETPLRCRVTFTPALYSGEQLEIICGLANDALADRRGQPQFLHLALMNVDYPMGDRLATMPALTHTLLLKAGAWIGRLLGWQHRHPKYVRTGTTGQLDPAVVDQYLRLSGG